MVPSKLDGPARWRTTHWWQYWASSISDTFFGKSSLLFGRTAGCRAHLRSHSGCNSVAAFARTPTTKEYTIPLNLFRVLLLERLQLPLPVTQATCEGCYSVLDVHGRHRAACTLSGRAKKACHSNRTCAGPCVSRSRRTPSFQRVLPRHERGRGRQQQQTQDLPCFGGAQLALDITLRSALARAGEPQRDAADVDGAVLTSRQEVGGVRRPRTS